MAGRQVAILGLGLIGASVGLALKQHSGTTVFGFDPDREARDRAATRGAIDRAYDRPLDAIQDADTILLAAPVRGIIDLLAEIGPHVGLDTLVTDTGSTKAAVVAQAE